MNELTLQVTEFKAKCLHLLDQVARQLLSLLLDTHVLIGYAVTADPGDRGPDVSGGRYSFNYL